MKKKYAVFILISLAAIVAVVCFVALPRGAEETSQTETVDGAKKGRLVRRTGQVTTNVREKVRNIVSTEPKDGRRRPRPDAEMFEHLRGVDRQLAESIQKALDDDNYNGVMKSVDAAMRSKNAEVRSHLVDALGWFGVEALPELTVLMADPDEEVAESAQMQWTVAIAEIESPGKRMQIGLSVLGTFSNKDMLDGIIGEVSNAAVEYIEEEPDDSDEADNAERQSTRRVEVVQALLDIMSGERPICAKAAAEAYEDITGYEWISIDEAELYLQNPDDYELPEDRDDVGEQRTQPPVEQPAEQPVGQPDEQPMEQPVEQPGEQPVDQPVEQPVEHPVEQPVEQPMDQPIEQPEQPVEQPVEQQPVEQPGEQPQPVDTPEPDDDDDDGVVVGPDGKRIGTK